MADPATPNPSLLSVWLLVAFLLRFNSMLRTSLVQVTMERNALQLALLNATRPLTIRFVRSDGTPLPPSLIFSYNSISVGGLRRLLANIYHLNVENVGLTLVNGPGLFANLENDLDTPATLGVNAASITVIVFNRQPMAARDESDSGWSEEEEEDQVADTSDDEPGDAEAERAEADEVHVDVVGGDIEEQVAEDDSGEQHQDGVLDASNDVEKNENVVVGIKENSEKVDYVHDGEEDADDEESGDDEV